MTTQIRPIEAPTAPAPIPALRHGDKLTRDEFERRYNAMPENIKAELLDGVVYMATPVSDDHGAPDFDFGGWLAFYRYSTPGVAGSHNGTVLLDLASEPQPDSLLRILESHGGNSRLSPKRYVEGSPELVGEVAVSSISVDLDVKLPLYQRNGVREYILWRVPDGEIDWFVLRGDHYERLPLGADGVYRSEVLPGLWLAPLALIRGNLAVVQQVAQQGLDSPEHADFVRRLREHYKANNP